MIKIKTLNKRAQQLIAGLVELILGNGGFIHPNLKVLVVGNDLSVSFIKKLNKGEQLIALPLSCMPILSDFEYTIKNHHMIATPKESRSISLVHRDVMSMSVELYNLFDKVEDYSHFSPPIQLKKHSVLCQTLLKASKAEAFSDQLFKTPNDLKIVCFWHNRAYYDVDSATDRLIPFLEFVDHHSFADGYRAGSLPSIGDIVELRYIPIEASKAVYVSYSLIDALQTFVKYGFVDRSSFFVQSQPFVFNFPKIGDVQINNQNVNACQLPPENWLWQPASGKNALFYASQIAFVDGVLPEIKFCLIPPARHINACDEAFAHQLAMLEKWGGLAKGQLNNNEVLLSFKSALIRENKLFYKHLVKLTKAAELSQESPVTAMFRDMLKHQIKIIKQYEKNAL